jgi:hypothetical protein
LTTYEEELVELEGTYPKMKVRKQLLNNIWHDWLVSFGTLSPKQGEHIRKAMALAVFESKYLSCTNEELKK